MTSRGLKREHPAALEHRVIRDVLATLGESVYGGSRTGKEAHPTMLTTNSARGPAAASMTSQRSSTLVTLILALLALVQQGCTPPHATGVEDWRITALTPAEVDSAYSVKLQNDAPFAWPIVELTGKVYSQDRELATMTVGQGALGSIPAHGQTSVPMASQMQFANMVSALSGTGLTWGSEIPFKAKVQAAVKLPTNNRYTLPEITIEGALPILAPPTASLDGLPQFTERTKDRCRCAVKVKVNNPNRFDLSLRTLDGTLQLKELGSNPPTYRSLTTFSLGSPATIAAQSSSTVTFNLDFVPTTIFSAPSIPPLPSSVLDWPGWGVNVATSMLAGGTAPPASTRAHDWEAWAQNLLSGWWSNALDALTVQDNYKWSFSTKFRTPHAPFDIPFSFGN